MTVSAFLHISVCVNVCVYWQGIIRTSDDLLILRKGFEAAAANGKLGELMYVSCEYFVAWYSCFALLRSLLPCVQCLCQGAAASALLDC